MTDSMSAAAQYKELTAMATSAAKRLQRHEADKAAQLEGIVATTSERIAEAEEDHQRVVEAVELRWDEAMRELFEERWLRVTQMPEPDTSAAPAKADDAIRSVQAAYLALRDALGRPRWQTPWFSRRKGS